MKAVMTIFLTRYLYLPGFASSVLMFSVQVHKILYKIPSSSSAIYICVPRRNKQHVLITW